MSDAPGQATEYVLSTSPFVVRRRVRWGECDPAGVVYTGRFVDYLISAVSLFQDHVFSGFSEGYRKSLGIETPCKALSMVFSGALWPNDVFDMQVRVGSIRNTSYDVCVEATRADGSAAFSATFSPICIPGTERRAVPIPAEMRARLEADGKVLPGSASPN